MNEFDVLGLKNILCEEKARCSWNDSIHMNYLRLQVTVD